ncbi:MAG: hypothetical protein QM796_19955 [Chthoniobacteraceae bacterium]
MSEELYKQAAASAGAVRPAPVPKRPRDAPKAREEGQGDVVDAEFEVVDEDKKK